MNPPDHHVATPGLAAALLAGLLSACSHPPLEDRPSAAVDLSGHWCLVRADLDEALTAAEQRAGVDSRRPDDHVASSLSLPLQMRAERIRIEQGRDFTRINYGDLLIREYNWGSRNNLPDVEVGWEQEALVVRTSLGQREHLLERYSLSPAGDRLVQETAFSSSTDHDQQSRRTFERIGANTQWCRPTRDGYTTGGVRSR